MSDQTSPPNSSGGFAQFLTGRLRSKLAAGVTHLTSGSGPTIDYLSPPGDLGLFGPDSVCWKVHADFTSMNTPLAFNRDSRVSSGAVM